MRRVGGFLIVLASSLLGPTGAPASADDARAAWGADLDALRLEADPAKRVERTFALLAKSPDAAALRSELSRPLAWKADAPKGLVSWAQTVEATGGGASTLTVFAHVPASYEAGRAWPVLVWLHGGVNRDEDGGGAGALEPVAATLGKDAIVLAPSANRHCAWWSPKGVDHVRAALAELARRYHVDADRVAAAGFSDGGSGCFHLLTHAPDAYASFVSLMGNPIVSRVVGGPMCLANASSRPLYALNGGDDPLYPAAQMEPVIEELKQGGAQIAWQGLADAAHDLRPALEKVEEIVAFVAGHRREALPAKLDWECALPGIDGRRAWVEVLKVTADAPGQADLALQPLPLPAETRRPRLGITIDRTHEGRGLKIEDVQSGTPAADAGFKPGDVVVKVGEDELPTGTEAFLILRAYLEGLANEDGTFVVQRGEERVTLTTRPKLLASDVPPAALGYGLPTGRVVATRAAADRLELASRGVASLRLHLSRSFVDFDRDLTVVWNGKTVFQGRVKPDAAYLLSEALRGLPGDPLYEATLTLHP